MNPRTNEPTADLSRREFVAKIAMTIGGLALASDSLARASEQSIASPSSASPAVSIARGVRKMNPPKLDSAYLGKEVHCYRPMRHGSPNLSVEAQGKQLIAHNYGHGGSGWTLAPGSAAYVVDLTQQSEHGQALAKDAPITVVGAGVIGLFTAYELVKRGYTNVTVVAERFDGLTSHNAGGLLAPVSMDNAPEMQKIIDKIGVDAYRFFASVAKGTNADFAKGASIVPAYFDSREDSGLEPYVGQVMEPAKDITLDFGNGTTRDMVVYDDGIFMDPARMMQSLRDYLEGKVTFEQRKVTSIADLPSALVFNCTGLGARTLEGDEKMVPVQGHLIMLKDQVPADLQSMVLIYYPKGKTASGQEAKRSFYIFPKQLPGSGLNDIGVVGGTFIEGATPETPNDEEFQILIEGAKLFYGITVS
jgi:D-amino-acid oxidase